MSIKLMDKAFNAKVGNPLTKLLLIKLADNANDEGVCYPSYKKVAQQCEISRQTAIGHTKKLAEMGYISIKERKTSKGHSSNLYILHSEKWEELPPLTSQGALPPLVNEVDHPSQGALPPLVNEVDPEPSIEPSINPNKKTTQKSEAEILLEQFGVTGQLAKDFIAHRKAKKGVISETQMNRLQKQADKAGISICEAISICIERNWQGFNATWDWRDEKLRPLNTSSKMSFEEKNALPWNRPEDWVGVL
ncbi:DNA-binding protein [Rodentibacter ratti]|uniref:DNA-binding protein n=1 Tax=Rodentibacter ratti TaxID=1906745 RepID=A0A1V3L495_9PAST|nr:helix-turn-helix domain-containing protein [Rodentibacter ratti]OOF84621.1 DNA-binding protein [Rodentibacter ratti]